MDRATIQDLLDRYLAGTCSVRERQAVEEWLERQEEGYDAWSEMEASARTAWMAGLRRDIQASIKGKGIGVTGVPVGLPVNGDVSGVTKVIPIYRRRWAWLSAGAAAVLLLAGGWWLMRTPASEVRTAQNGGAAHDVQPGGNKAILTLANGSTIVLDSAANGSLARQGNTTILKTAGGQLAYDASAGKAADILYNTLATPRGGQYQLVLPDGSKVWLNAASSIRYPTAFAGKERRVMVTGEAYFEIKQDAAMPFVVTLHDKLDVKVLGTSFDINAYEDEPAVRTTLLEGAVQVRQGESAVLLSPGGQARATRGGDITVLGNVDVEETVAWKNGKFSCKNMALEDIMRQVARWYDVEVMYKDRITDRYTLSVGRDVPVSNLLRYLEMSEGVHFSVEGKKIIVSK